MSGSILKYLDEIVKGFRSANDVASARSVLAGMSSELDIAFAAKDGKALDDLIKRVAENGTEAEKYIFRSEALQRNLRNTRSRIQFGSAFDEARAGGKPVDVEKLRQEHGLAANDPSVTAAKRVVSENPGRVAGTGTVEERLAAVERQNESLRRRDVMNFVGRYNEFVHKAASRTGPFKGVILAGHTGLLWSGAIIGVGGTALSVAGLAHLGTDGESTRLLTRLASDTATNLYHGLKDVAPGLAELLKQKTPEMTSFAFTALTLQTDMIKESIGELDRKHNLGIGANSGALAHVIEGNIIMGAFQKVTGVELGAQDVERIMRGAMNEPDKKAYIAREFSRLTGKAEGQFAEALASPEVFDITGMTPEQIQQMFGQTSGVTPGGAAPGAAAPTVIDRAKAALGRRTDGVRDAARTTVDQATEVVRIGRLSGSGLVAEFNKVADEKGLSWFSSPQMFMIKLMDSIGFDFFGLNNMLKKQVLLDNVKTQFGDQFGVLARNGQNLNLDNTAPAPSSG